jgi:dihydroorotase
MKLLIKGATIVDSRSSLNGEKRDILIEDGIIAKIGKRINASDAEIVKEENLHVSIGWMDIGVQVCDPGLEHREDLESVIAAAASGGYTSIACFPNSDPTVHNKSQVKYITKQTKGEIVDCLPIGAVTHDCNGKDITEMYDMTTSGAVSFSDGNKPIADNGMMLRALQYVKPFDGVILNHPHDLATAHSGQMHEGYISTTLGLKGIPSLSEELMIFRDLQLLSYADSRLHIHNISTKNGVELIRAAKKQGLKVTASVAVMNLAFQDDALADFDTNMKVLPPLREKSDSKALIKGLKDGTIDCITSNHVPWNMEAKDLEFLYAEFGAIGLETTFGLAYKTLEGEMSLADIIDRMSHRPRAILHQEILSIEEGKKANLTLFIPEQEFVFEADMIKSKSKNTSLIGEKLKGKVFGVVNNGGLSCC